MSLLHILLIPLKIAALPLKTFAALWQATLGWWIGRSRGWTPEGRNYGAISGYEIKHGRRRYWWDGRKRTLIE